MITARTCMATNRTSGRKAYVAKRDCVSSPIALRALDIAQRTGTFRCGTKDHRNNTLTAQFPGMPLQKGKPKMTESYLAIGQPWVTAKSTMYGLWIAAAFGVDNSLHLGSGSTNHQSLITCPALPGVTIELGAFLSS